MFFGGCLKTNIFPVWGLVLGSFGILGCWLIQLICATQVVSPALILLPDLAFIPALVLVDALTKDQRLQLSERLESLAFG